MNKASKRIIAFIMAISFLLTSAFTAVFAEEKKEEANLVNNPGFELLTADENPEGWSPMGGSWETTPHIFTDSETVKSGERSLRITTDKEGNPWCRTTVDNVVVGAEYELSAYINATFSGEVGKGVGFKGESNGDAFANIDLPTLKYGTNGQWVQHVNRFTIPAGAKTLTIYCRLFANGTAWFDDLKLTRAADPPKYSFSIDDVFHYPDQKSGTAYVNINPFFDGTSVAADTSVDFELSDGETVLDKQYDTKVTGNSAKYNYDTKFLSEMKKQYTIKAVVKYKSGDEPQEYTQSVYKYPRPEWITEDGRFKADGEDYFDPVIGYHVDIDKYDRAKEMGLTVVQIPYWYTSASKTEVEAREKFLNDAQAKGLKILFCLYRNMKMAADPANLNNTKYVVDLYKDDPRIFAWAIMDEPIGAGITAAKLKLLEDSYRAVRDIDDKHPVYLVDYSEANNKTAAMYCDIFAADYYPVGSTQGLYKNLGEVRDNMVAGKKPFYYIGPAFQNSKGTYIPTVDFMRAFSYTALEEGAKGLGHYSISDAVFNEEGTRIGWYDMPQWEGLCDFGINEVPELFDYFVNKKYKPFGVNFEQGATGMVWYSWIKGNDIYWVVHNRAAKEASVDVPLKSTNGLVSIEGYTAVGVGGHKNTVKGNGALPLKLDKEQVVMYKITPENKLDLTKLDAGRYSDLEGYEWAEEAIAALAGKNIVNSISEGKFAPGQNITRADFAMFLVRTLNLKSDSTENFADVDSSAYYAKELAAGKATGILQGVGEGNFNPSAEISRQDMLTIVLRGLKFSGKEVTADDNALDKFGDRDSIAEYAKEAVAAMTAAEVVAGDENGNFNPKANATRAEAAVIMYRISKLDIAASVKPAEPEKPAVQEIEFEKVTFNDTPTEQTLDEWVKAAAFIGNFGIVESNFNVESAVSRAEAAKIFVKILGGVESAFGNSGFADVPETSEYAKYISAVRDLGYMGGTGDGNFSPGKPLSYNAAVKVLMSMMGYDVYAQRDGGYPSGYLANAARTGLLKGTANRGEEPVRAGELAKLIRNAFDIETVTKTSFGGNSDKYETEKDTTLLSKYFGVYKKEGKITANYLTSLTGIGSLSKTQVSLDGEILETGKSGAEKFLGQNVTVYVNQREENKIIAIESGRNTKIHTVNGEDVLTGTGDRKLLYSSDGNREYSFSINGDAILVYNGAVKNGWGKQDLLNVNGIITLVENRSGNIDVVFIDNYETKVIDRVDPDTYEIFFKDNTGKVYDLREAKTLLVDKNGKEVSFGKIAEWNILSTAESIDGKVVKGILSTEIIKGKVLEKSGEKLKIGEREYAASEAVTAKADVGSELSFYPDFRGKIIAVNKGGDVSNYAYFTSIMKDKGLTDTVKMRIFTSDGKMEIVELAEKVRFNDDAAVNRTVVAESPLLTVGGEPVGQLIVYKKNESGEIIEVKTAQDGRSIPDPADKQDIFTLELETGTVYGGTSRYVGYGMKIFAERFRITSNTKIFIVPNKYSSRESDYAIRQFSYFHKESGTYYNAKLYDIDENYYTKAYVQEMSIDSTTTDGLDTRYGAIKRIGKKVNAEGETVLAITIVDYTGVEMEVTYEPSGKGTDIRLGSAAFTDPATEKQVEISGETRKVKEYIDITAVNVGDVVEYYKNDGGKLIAMNILARSNSLRIGESSKQGMTEYYTYSVLSQFCGYIEEIIEGGYVITPVKYKRIMFYAGYPVASPICLYDKAENTLEVITANQIKVGDLVYAVRVSPYQKMNLIVR